MLAVLFDKAVSALDGLVSTSGSEQQKGSIIYNEVLFKAPSTEDLHPELTEMHSAHLRSAKAPTS